MIGIGSNLAYQPAVSRYSSGADLEFMFENGSAHPVEGNAALVVTRPGDTGTRFTSAGVIETVAANMARITHDPSVLRFENLIKWSEEFSNAVWTKASITVTPNSSLGPDGKLSRSTVTRSSTVANAYVQQAASAGAGSVVTASLSAELGTVGTFLGLRIQGTYPSRADVVINLATGATVFSGATGFTLGAIDVSPDEGGGYTITLTATADATGVSGLIFGPTTIASAAWEAATATLCNANVTRAQLNTGSTALEYQRTGATAFAKGYACKGLLAEDARSNVVRNGDCAGSGTAASAGTAIGPDGVAATKVIPFAGAAAFPASGITAQAFANSQTVGQTTDYAFSGYFSPIGPNNYKPYLVIQAVGGGPNLYALVLFDATTGAFSVKTLEAGWAEISAPTAVMHPCGMYFVTWVVRFTQPAILRTSVQCFLQIKNELNQSSYTADGVSGIQRSCNQFEKDSVSSYIPTTTVSATRNADVPVAMVKMRQFNDAMTDEAKCTVLVTYTNGTKLTGTRALSFRDSGGTSQLEFVAGNGSGEGAYVNAIYGGVTVATLPAAGPLAVAGATNTVVFACETSNFAGSRNGAVAQTDSLGLAPPLLDRIYIGCNSGGAQQINGTIGRVAVWGLRRKSNADIAQQSA